MESDLQPPQKEYRIRKPRTMLRKYTTQKSTVPISTDPTIRFIPLTQDQFATVDAEDYESLSRFNWCAHWHPKKQRYYAVGAIWSTNDPGGKATRSVLMHRFIMGEPKGLTIDHRDRDGLNNRRSNLRAATYSQNNCNRFDPDRGTSRFKGVTKYKNTGRWRVRVKIHGKEKWVGVFDTQEQAAEAYAKASADLHGEFALAGERAQK